MKHLNLRLPDDLHERAKAAAAVDDRSLNSWLVAAVRRAVEEAERRSAQERNGFPCPAPQGSHSPPA